jgi:hypothetical protein
MIRFSNSTLGTFEDCPRCFWLEQHHKIKRPRGIFPSQPGGVDRILKPYFDNHAGAGTFPPEMAKLVEARPYLDRVKMQYWRNWRNLQVEVDGIAMLSGALDELIVWPDGIHSPYDYKTRGAPPVEGASEEYYGTQLDIYHLLIEQGCGLKCNGDGYLGYYWPIEVTGHGDFKFATDVIKLSTDPARAVKLVHDAIKCLEGTEPPAAETKLDKKGNATIGCEYCSFVMGRHPHEAALVS